MCLKNQDQVRLKNVPIQSISHNFRVQIRAHLYCNFVTIVSRTDLLVLAPDALPLVRPNLDPHHLPGVGRGALHRAVQQLALVVRPVGGGGVLAEIVRARGPAAGAPARRFWIRSVIAST